jgi:hypothetical protein
LWLAEVGDARGWLVRDLSFRSWAYLLRRHLPAVKAGKAGEILIFLHNIEPALRETAKQARLFVVIPLN